MPIDYKRYPANWKKEIVPRVIKRANNRCEICGIENKATIFSTKIWIRDKGRYKYKTIWFSNENDIIRMRDDFLGLRKKVTVVLTIAHLDHDETNHDVTDDRLMAMCQYCHLNYDAKEKYRRAIKF